MIIHATKKALKIAGITALANIPDDYPAMPGSWTATVISLGVPGKMATLLVHDVTRITLLLEGKSLNATLPRLKDQLILFLQRTHHMELLPLFLVQTPIQIYAPPSRSMTAHVNTISGYMPYQFKRHQTAQTLDFQRIEDIYYGYIFTTKQYGKKFITTSEILDRLRMHVVN